MNSPRSPRLQNEQAVRQRNPFPERRHGGNGGDPRPAPIHDMEIPAARHGNHVVPVLILLGFALALSPWFGLIANMVQWAGQTATTAGTDRSVAAAGPVQPNPWAIQEGAADRIRAAGLPVMTDEGTGEHFHDHLDVYVDGKSVTVPTGIGFTDPTQGETGGRSPVHTHDASGIIHIEAASPGERYTLGQVLRQWGVLADTGAIGGSPAAGWAIFVNGTRQQTDPYTVTLQPKQEIVLVRGTAPDPLPATYNFPANL